MPIGLVRDERRPWLIARATGSLSIEEMTAVLQTARADIHLRTRPLVIDARSCTTSMTDDDVEQAVAIVRAGARRQCRGHVAVVADDDRLYQWFLLYEARCADVGKRGIRAFRAHDDAVRWLEIVSVTPEYG
jgi:hypothetical protein